MPAFSDDPLEISRRLKFVPQFTVSALRSLQSRERRMQLVMWLVGQAIPEVVPLLIAAVGDPHPDVQMSAIKCLAPWPDKEGVRECLERLVNSGRAEELQPYPGMVLRTMKRDWADDLELKLREE